MLQSIGRFVMGLLLGILIGAGNPLRLVTHLDISAGDVDNIVAAFGDYFASPRNRGG